MKISEAILRSLEDIKGLTNYNDVTEHIISNKYYEFKEEKNPPLTVSAFLARFIREGDTRVKRIKQSGAYFYYLTKNEHTIDLDNFESIQIKSIKKEVKNETDKSFTERDLHKLLSSFLRSTGIYAKTIFHEQSKNKDNNQIWTHPDMIGIRFLNLQNKISQNFLRAIDRTAIFKLNSYELKKELNTDSELKKAFFQAVSNSSWANYGYLVAFEISDSLIDEMERLNQSFGIGIIQLNANPFQSKIRFQAKYRELDFKTIDKLCKLNREYEQFIELIEKLMNADERYYKAIEKELDEFCDNYYTNDTDALKYCNDKNIPTDEE